jgi:hypothetical protein
MSGVDFNSMNAPGGFFRRKPWLRATEGLSIRTSVYKFVNAVSDKVLRTPKLKTEGLELEYKF